MKTKLTADDIAAAVADVRFVPMPDGRTTICQLTLTNGFTVRGESSCVCVENFDRAIGEQVAHRKALDKVWELEGYLLAQRRFEAGL